MTDQPLAPKMPAPTIERPTPTATWYLESRARARGNFATHVRLRAGFAADTDEVRVGATPGQPPEHDGDLGVDADPGILVPNNFTIDHHLDRVGSPGGYEHPLRLTRAAAVELIAALTAALEWDGR